MTKAQAQDLIVKLLTNDVVPRVFQQAVTGEWVVRASKPGSTVTSTLMTTIAASVVPASPVVVARTDEVEFI